MTDEPPTPGRPELSLIHGGDILYYVNVETGRCIGYGFGPNRPDYFVADR